jgi:hypothetical protein
MFAPVDFNNGMSFDQLDPSAQAPCTKMIVLTGVAACAAPPMEATEVNDNPRTFVARKRRLKKDMMFFLSVCGDAAVMVGVCWTRAFTPRSWR